MKILLSAPTSQHKDYCMKQWTKWITASDFSDFQYDILIVDNSKDKNYHKQIEKELYSQSKISCEVVHLPYEEGRSIQKTIADSNEVIRKYFLEHKYEYLLFNESDVFAPKNTIDYLVAMNTEVVGLPYFLYQHYVSKIIQYKVVEAGYNREYTIGCVDYSFINFRGQVDPSYNIGLGCLLIKKEVLQEVDFTIEDKEGTPHSDTFFHHKLKKLGISSFQSQKNIAYHFNSSWSELGKTNSKFDEDKLKGFAIDLKHEFDFFNKTIEFEDQTISRKSKVLPILEQSVMKLQFYYDLESENIKEKKELTYKLKAHQLEILLAIQNDIISSIETPVKLVKLYSLGEVDIETFKRTMVFNALQTKSEINQLFLLSGEVDKKQNEKPIKDSEKILDNKIKVFKNYVDLLLRKKKLLHKHKSDNELELFSLVEEIKSKREFIEAYSRRRLITNDIKDYAKIN